MHVPIHSNATTFNCTAPFDPAKGGTWLLYKPNSSAGISLSQKIYDKLRGQSPGTLDRIGTDVDLTGGTAFHELRATNMASAYVEAAFHTYRPDVDWLRNPTTVGNLIGAGIDNYFGIPRCPPCPLSDPGSIGAAPAEPAPPQGMAGQDFADSVESATLEDAIEQLASGSTGAPFFEGSTSGLVAEVRVTPQGLAVVDFRGLSTAIPSGAPSAVISDFITGLNDTVFADPSVSAIEYRSDGSCAAFWAWFDAECQRIQRPQLRG